MPRKLSPQTKKKKTQPKHPARIAIAMIMLLLLLIIAALQINSNKKPRNIGINPATPTPTTLSSLPSPSSQSAASASSPSSTPSTSKASPTATPKAGSTASSPAAPTPTPFSVTANAQKIFNEITQCSMERYIFAGSATANQAGTVNWQWIRWDGGTSGVSGTMTFAADGSTNDGISSYQMWIHPTYDVSGWVALKFTWNGGSYTSNYATFNYVYDQVDPPGQCP